MLKRVNPDTLPPSAGQSHIVISDAPRTAFLSGQVALDGANNLVGEGDFGTQVRQVVTNLDNALAAAAMSAVEAVFVLGEADGAESYTSLLRREGELPDVRIDPREDLIALPYSSGTTGMPKGVMLTHYNLVANVSQFGDLTSLSERETMIAILPFFHIFGMVAVMAYGLRRRATLVTMPRFELETFLQLLQDHAIDRAFLVPPIVLALAKHPRVDDYDLSSLKFILCGAAPQRMFFNADRS